MSEPSHAQLLGTYTLVLDPASLFLLQNLLHSDHFLHLNLFNNLLLHLLVVLLTRTSLKLGFELTSLGSLLAFKHEFVFVVGLFQVALQADNVLGKRPD